MRTIRFIKHVICILFIGIFAASCSSSEEPQKQEGTTKGKVIQVPIGFSGEITNITESPLTKATTPKDWYVFQVYSSPKDENNYTYYAYGFFDNKQNMVINLKEGYKYKFDVSMVVGAEGKVNAFSLVNAGWARINNNFIVSSEEHVRYMYNGYLYLSTPYQTFDRPDVDRFFGSTTDYIPEEGKTVNINMKRVSFGAKFVAKNFTEGSLEINVEGAPAIKLAASEGSIVQDIISFNNLQQAYDSDEYTEEIPVNIIWTKNDNTKVPIASSKVQFKRNKMTTIEFTVRENTTSNSFNLSANESMGDGEKVEIGGDGTNNNVNPQK